MRIRHSIAIATLLPAAVAFAVAPTAGTASEDGTCRTDEARTVTVTAEDGTESETPVEYCQTTVYAQCDNAVDTAAAGKVILPTEGVKLTAAAPTASFTEGAGCGTVDEPIFSVAANGPSQYQFFADGFADAGDTDSLTVELHWLGPSGAYAGEDLHLDMRIEVDGVSLFGYETSPDATGQPDTVTRTVSDQRIVVPGVVSSSGASVMTRFTVTGLDDLFEPLEPGGFTFRTVKLGFGPPHTGECTTLPTNETPRCVPSGFSGLVMGATEIPTGVVFNPAEPAEVTVPVVLEDD